MSIKTFCVYMHTNKINDKKYIGITCRNPKLRWQNGKGYINNEYFYRAILKYGWDNFEHDILYRNLTKEQACLLEVELIKQYHTQYPKYGYNITAGGDFPKIEESIKDEWGEKNSNRTLDKMRNRKLSEESKRNISLNNPRRREVVCESIQFESVRKCASYYHVSENTMRDWLKGRATTPIFFVENNLHYVDENPNYHLDKGRRNAKSFAYRAFPKKIF